jgi:hypothetical protein
MVRRPPKDGPPGANVAQACCDKHKAASKLNDGNAQNEGWFMTANVRHERRQKGKAFLTSARWSG